MRVELNGKSIAIADPAMTLAQLLKQEGLTGVNQAVAIDNRVVPAARWDSTLLQDAMKIIVIKAVCGG